VKPTPCYESLGQSLLRIVNEHNDNGCLFPYPRVGLTVIAHNNKFFDCKVFLPFKRFFKVFRLRINIMVVTKFNYTD